MISIVKISKFKYSFESETKAEEDVVKDILTCQVDGYFFSPAYKEELWDGKNRFYDKNKQFYHGMLSEVVSELKKQKIPYTIQILQPLKLLQEIKIDSRLKIHQVNAIKAFFEVNYGIIKVPTRGGKTFIASEAIRQVILDYKDSVIVFFVDGVDLFKQSIIEISNYLGLSASDIGTINGKGLNIKNINVAMIQTVGSALSSKKNLINKKALLKLFNSTNFLIVDELHEYSSKKRLNVLKKFKNVDFCMGLSATPYKQSDMIGNLNLKGFFNHICYEIKEKELIESGVLAENKVILVMFDHKLNRQEYDYIENLPGTKRYRALENKLILKNEIRDSLLLQILQICSKLELKTLVLFNSVEHGKSLSNAGNYMFIHGSDNSETREKEKIEFLEGRGKVLFASNIYKKGITLSSAQVLINADGGYEDTNLIQKKGRVLGTTNKKNKALIIDIIDIYKEYFSKHGLNRLRTYEEAVGLDKIEPFEINDLMIDGIKSSLIDWFKDDNL